MKTRTSLAAACMIALAPMIAAQGSLASGGDLSMGGGAAGVGAESQLEEHEDAEPAEIWTNFGCALEGSLGEPILYGTGSLAADSRNAIELTGALPEAAAVLFVGFQSQPTPFKGGLLLPVPAPLQFPMAVDAEGGIRIDFTWPAQMPGGFDIYMQFVILDPGAVQGYALSSALAAHAP